MVSFPKSAIRNPQSAIPTVPFSPQPVEQLRARFPEALVGTYDEHSEPVPGEMARHIFDFEDGCRVIVSWDRLQGGVRMHASFSFPRNVPLHASLMWLPQGERLVPALAHLSRHLIALIDPPKSMPPESMIGFDLIGISPGGVIHMAGPRPAEFERLCEAWKREIARKAGESPRNEG